MAETKVIAEPGKQEIIVTRLFDAPPSLVFKTMTDPALIPHWWGPAYLTTTVERMELRKGGIWRYIQRDPEGNEYAFNGVYHSVQEPERLVYTFEWEGMPGHILLETLTLEERNGQTLMTDQSVFQSVADRDGMLASGMEEGTNESTDRLEKLLQQALQAAGVLK
jgi:uncharacterized protein YndB with AHSA1/START domain